MNTGTVVALAGVLVVILNHFGINIVQGDVEAVLGAVATVYGIIHQLIVHKGELRAAQTA